MQHRLETILGMRIIVEEPRLRYVLPDDVPPPPGMTRGEFAAWSLRTCGVCAPLLPDGQVFKVGDTLHMNERTYAYFSASTGGTT